ncbi:MAG TPA: aminotransferase class I/II-fold pyridoxal phosphate-dependent enzyme, partial [Fimbriimonadaceae bacterium]|nr:aminotransferase class I/II-fold pyridoxal phosphate-dependent enzyme [Fimbriimonadaceae bacterium]
MQGYSLDTLLQHFGEEEKILGAVTPPIFQNSLFVFDEYEGFLETMLENPGGPPHHYSRFSNPTVEVVEKKIALLERAEECKVFGSGMAAISCAMLSCLQAGSHVVAVDTCYQPVRKFLDLYLPKFGVRVTYVDGTSTEELLDEIRPETSCIYLESPSSLVFRLQDLEAIARVAREKGITTICDNSYASPLYQNPLEFGIDLVVHSATKYLAGHSDITAGVVCGSAERIDGILRNELQFFGSIIAPFPAWLLLRGLRTLKRRLKQHELSGNRLAAWLRTRPEVERVHHVSFEDHPQRDLYLKQMRGSGGLLSF